MNKILYSILLLAGIAYSLGSCSSGAYIANPSSNANGSINPLNPLKAGDFVWPNDGHKVSLNINGSHWSTDSASVYWVDSIGTNVIFAYGNGKYLIMELQNVWGNNLYNMGYKQYDKYALWTDSIGYSAGYYQSVLGNSGEIYMTANDTVNFCGKFYFQAIDGAGHIDNITNGDFKLTK